ncbi:4-alpha-glucanotransferase [Meridianimarinicoccus roseus]|uniref:4-alpha-glucanotransferase n=1 Tax=Meridianimarinicoccus roseus TaxID=2072018 RepID=A0A2V2LMV4_9RHOB|nr:4-alpha-glucanotransferase [Meridianimarinicoccus roseus]PWR03619.1 4-alpha-glucanotransferase [Meridianimarinicoccus roseus]
MIVPGSALDRLATAAGIVPRYRDVTGALRETGADAARALLAAMGLPAGTEPEALDALDMLRAPPAEGGYDGWHVVTSGAPAQIEGQGPWHLLAEDGTEAGGDAAGRVSLPALSAGYHRLLLDGRALLVIAAPPTLPAPARGWGVTLPLYGLRTAAEGGFGDYADLSAAVTGLGGTGADFVGINPIHAGFPTDPDAFSPYSPSSRQRLNTAHLALPGRPGSPGDLIDYAADRPAHLAALRAAYAALSDAARAASVAHATDDADLWRFAVHQALADRHGPYWPDWPAALRRPDNPEVAAFAAAAGDGPAFHAWAQQEAATQLGQVRDAAAAAGMRHGLYLDLAVGTHPGGAETWAEPEVFARGVSLGAPPDAFSPGGQSWGIAPFDPRALAARGFKPFIDTLRAQFRFARLLRVDHVLGFERAFWVPENGAPGAYVTMPRAALLAITRIEAARAGATVVGEDLGNVPEGLRDAMQEAGVLGCRVAMFERDQEADVTRYRPGSAYDTLTLASFASHDLPTWKGWRTGRDLEWWARIGQLPGEDLPAARATRAAEVAAFDTAHGTADGTADALHLALAGSAAALVAVQAEDMLGLTEQPNLPGTIDAHPNWRRRLPVPAADLGRDAQVLRSAALMRR